MECWSVLVALDFSLRSPGVCVCRRSAQGELEYEVYGFYRGREISKEFTENRLAVQLLRLSEPEDDPAAGLVVSNLRRYQELVERVVSRCFQPLLAGPGAVDPSRVRVVIESYAFMGRSQSGANYKLHEVTGILKYQLFRLDIRDIHELAAPAWRRAVFGTCSAGKAEALARFSADFPACPLLQLCSRSLGKNGTVPTPVQDICEAYCLCVAAASYDFARAAERRASRKKPGKRHTGLKRARAKPGGAAECTTPTKHPKTMIHISADGSAPAVPATVS